MRNRRFGHSQRVDLYNLEISSQFFCFISFDFALSSRDFLYIFCNIHKFVRENVSQTKVRYFLVSLLTQI